VRWEEVLAEPIVWREPHSGIRRRVEAAIVRAGLRARYSVEVTGVEALRDAVAAGLGIGFASVEALDKVRWPLASLRLDPPHGLFWTLYLMRPQADFQSRAVRAFLDLLATPD
ncbi:LysR substrate-binding domain-containing protein, partial [Acidithiobacillus ferridurans]